MYRPDGSYREALEAVGISAEEFDHVVSDLSNLNDSRFINPSLFDFGLLHAESGELGREVVVPCNKAGRMLGRLGQLKERDVAARLAGLRNRFCEVLSGLEGPKGLDGKRDYCKDMSFLAFELQACENVPDVVELLTVAFEGRAPLSDHLGRAFRAMPFNWNAEASRFSGVLAFLHEKCGENDGEKWLPYYNFLQVNVFRNKPVGIKYFSPENWVYGRGNPANRG
jgi:hypothetical protein